LVRLTNAATYARALEIYRSQNVLDLEIAETNGGWLIEGRVQGTQRKPYTVVIDLSLDEQGRIIEWDGDCSCPVGYQCKHGVALLIKAAYKGHQILGHSAPTQRSVPLTEEQRASQRQAERERLEQLMQMEQERLLLEWLVALERGGERNSATSAQLSTQYGDPRTARKENILYLLSVVQTYSSRPELQMEAATSTVKGNGDWSKPKALRGSIGRGDFVFDEATDADHDALQLMRAMPTSSTAYNGYNERSKVVLQGTYGIALLEKAAGTGRLFALDSKGMPVTKVQWGAPRRVEWNWNEALNAKTGVIAWALQAKLAGGNAKLCLNDPMLYLDSVAGECGPVEVVGLTKGQVLTLLNAPPLQTQTLKKHQAALAERLGVVPMPPVLEPLPILSGLPVKACLHLSLRPLGSVSVQGLVKAELQFEYGGHKGWWTGQGPRILIESGTVVGDSANTGRCMLERDPAGELEFITQLMQLGLSGDGRGSFGILGTAPQLRWLQWADNDYAALRDAGFEVTVSDALQDWVSRADYLEVKLTALGESPQWNASDATTSPWFDLSLGMEINGQRQNILPWLPELIAAAANSPRDPQTGQPEIPAFIFLKKPGGGFIRISTEALKPWMAALLDLVNLDFSGDTLRLSRLDAMRTTAALGEGVEWAGAQELREMVQQLSGHAEMPEVPVPASLNATLRPYQQLGLNWLQFLRTHGLAGILADDMGLGKTLQTLAHIQVEKDAGRLNRPALIIAPVSLMGNWRNEAARFCPELRVVVVHGKDRHEVVSEMTSHDVVIAPYSLLQRDKDRWLEAAWHLVVLDEAQNIKNASTHAAQIVGQLNTRHRLCLSGTPMENHLGEIWSLFYFLMPGFLGSQKRFQELFRTPIEKLGDPERMNQLRARITPFMLRRTKSLVVSELPPKVDTVVRVELEGKQADLYETIRLGMEKAVRDALESKGLAKSQITILDALLKLRQVCCDPKLLKLAAAQKIKHSAKLEQLMVMLPEMVAEGRRILLFSQFTTMLTLIEAELKKHNLQWVKLTGQSQNREALIQQFKDRTVPIFLISLKAGGVGLNLPQADTVIHYDPWWNPAVESQATDRAHRIGQTETVFVYKLVAQGTIEERILDLQERKAALANSMFSEAVGRKQPLFTESDLAELLRPLDR
jgi:superfamily II DNA or RNA helicase